MTGGHCQTTVRSSARASAVAGAVAQPHQKESPTAAISIEECMTPAHLGFDPAALRARYREERDKRMRDDGNEQYRQVIGDFLATSMTPTWRRASPATP